MNIGNPSKKMLIFKSIQKEMTQLNKTIGKSHSDVPAKMNIGSRK